MAYIRQLEFSIKWHFTIQAFPGRNFLSMSKPWCKNIAPRPKYGKKMKFGMAAATTLNLLPVDILVPQYIWVGLLQLHARHVANPIVIILYYARWQHKNKYIAVQMKNIHKAQKNN